MLESMSFTYDGISSDDLGVVMINPSNGLYKESFLPTRKILETQVNGRYKPYFNGIESTPLSFPISIYIEGWKDRRNLREIARWLYKPYYKPLYFESSPEQIYYAIFEGNSELLHNGCKEGYIALNVRCDSPFSYSPIKTYHYNVTGSLDVTLFNNGDITIRPKMRIIQNADSDIKIKNNANGQEFILTKWDTQKSIGVQVGEVVEIDCANEYIKSSYEETLNKFLYDAHNDIWLDFHEYSEATFTFTGNFDVEFSLEYAYLAEDNPIFF